jgi:hypothetical protein
MLISEAKELLKRNGFLVEAQEDIKLIDELKGISGWEIKDKSNEIYQTVDFTKEIAGNTVTVNFFLKKDRDGDYELDEYVKNFQGEYVSLFADEDYIYTDKKKIGMCAERYLTKVEHIFEFIGTNKIKLPKTKLNRMVNWEWFKNLYSSKAGDSKQKKIYALCKRYASTTSEIAYRNATVFPEYEERKTGKRIDLGVKCYEFEARRQHQSGLNRFHRLGVGQKYVLVIPERGEVWFNYYVSGGCYSRGPEKFTTLEELKSILMAA